MSRLFGAVRQIGYVVSDIDRAIEGWLAAGVGPFFRLNDLKTNYFRVHGENVPLNIRVALANSGDMQIELVEQLDDAPTPYQEFLLRYGPGVQHLGFWSDAFDADVGLFLQQGFSTVIEGEIHIDGDNGIRFSYFEPGYQPGTLIEVIDSSSPAMQEINRMIRRAAVSWDGSEPVRYL